MAQVGEFRVSLIGDTSRFAKPMQDATKQAETFSKAVNFTSASTDLHTAAVGRAAAADKAEEKTRQLKDASGENRAYVKGSTEDFALNAKSQSGAIAPSPSVATQTKVARDMEVAKAEVANKLSKSDSEAPKQSAYLAQTVALLDDIRRSIGNGPSISEAPAI